MHDDTDVIKSLEPTERLRVIDLLASLGFDVSDWANSKGGEERAASNPKYCYEWSYEDHEKKLIVLSLWHEDMERRGEAVIQRLNLRQTAAQADSSPQSRRALKMDFSLQKATRLKWPVRVILCDGPPRALGDTRAVATRRILDDQPWHVESYDAETGDCTLVRSGAPALFIDQFDLEYLPEGNAARKETSGPIFERSARVRRYVLERAKGRCELCGEKGFMTATGYLYLESHHIKPLSEGGKDSVDNVVALCPNHHREAHYGADKVNVRKALLNIPSLTEPETCQ